MLKPESPLPPPIHRKYYILTRVWYISFMSRSRSPSIARSVSKTTQSLLKTQDSRKIRDDTLYCTDSTLPYSQSIVIFHYMPVPSPNLPKMGEEKIFKKNDFETKREKVTVRTGCETSAYIFLRNTNKKQKKMERET